MFFKKVFYFLAFCSFVSFSQSSSERFPAFKACEKLQDAALETCFYSQVQNFVFANFKVPKSVEPNYKGTIAVLFEVNSKGNFVVQYIDANNADLIAESKRVFGMMPTINPPTFNGKATYAKYTISISIPLLNPTEVKPKSNQNVLKQDQFSSEPLSELDSLVYKKFQNPQFKSHLNIPFSHSLYAQFDGALNLMGANNHTASKPYTFSEVSKYYDLESEYQKLQLQKKSWWGRKIFNENLVQIQGDHYWFTMNPIFDLQLGQSSGIQSNATYVNTRGLQIRGALGNQLHFSTTIYESQGYFANYYNRFAESLKPFGGNPAVVPGIGIAKDFNTTQFDFPSAEANITFSPNSFFDLQLGNGRNFIGDGYRSLLISDAASPYPFLKLDTKFWKIKYTNLYTWMKDIRPEAVVDRTYATKFTASHYLSWNVNNRLNIGFFESVVWSNQNNRGFDFNFVNPIIFYRAVEFSSSSKTGNALLGLSGKYKLNNQFNAYGQFLVDEFSFAEVKAGNDSWKNKFAYQVGIKYYNAFKINNLLLQLEYNHVRPYVYSHSDALTNYGHANQSLGHNWGGNAKEFVAIARYRKNRYYADFKLTYGIRGFDFDDANDSFNYGSNIFKPYDINRPFDNGVVIGQGNKTAIVIADLQTGYLLNPNTNLKLFGSLFYRNFKPNTTTDFAKTESTTWFSFGIRSDVFNWYFDY